MRPTDKSANVKERYKSVERSYGKGARCTKQCKVGKMQRKHKRGHTFQCVFVGVYKRMYLYCSVYTIDYNYEISHIFFCSCFLLYSALPRPNVSPQNQTKLDKIDKIRPNKCCCFFVCLCFCY